MLIQHNNKFAELAKMAENVSSRNCACIVNCLKKGDIQLLHSLVEELTGEKLSSQDVEKGSVCWRVDNKYYTAEIELFIVPSSKKLSKKREYQALIFLCDLDCADVLETLESSWTKIKQHDESDVRVVMGVATSDTPTVEVLKWCVCEGMELVEWERGENPQPQDTDSDDGLPPEAMGVARLSETLQAHMWPNITMKGRDPTATSQTQSGAAQPAAGNDMNDLTKLEAKATASASKEEEVRNRVDELLLTDDQLSALKDSEDPGGEKFEDLFSRFSQMKQHAESLPHEERKVYAERVAMAFWDAIGGDKEELATD
ncbi:alpha- and gamma-adaptin-binding protein p34-like [Halichondria panicea]|uniref:alpha- and gamma-adaptin-binding protein p34-like n=1 Tax=Halichondria panicea TaxID=6063 RepID=UPI00312BB5BB